jgi:hypothetical protein
MGGKGKEDTGRWHGSMSVSQHASLASCGDGEGGGRNRLTRVFWATQQCYAALTLHHRRDGIAKELGLWSKLADNGDLVPR